MCGYVVSTTAGFDAPQKTRELIRRQDGQFLAGYTPEDRMRIRDEIVSTSPDTVRKLGSVVQAVAKAAPRCVFGNREIIEGAKSQFDIVDVLGS